MGRIAIFGIFVWGSLFSMASTASAGWSGRVEEAKTGRVLGLSELGQALADSDFVILGEKHDVSAIQLAQAGVIAETASRRGSRGFGTAWEFLDAADQGITRSAWNDFVSGSIDSSGFLTRTQGSDRYRNYAPILEITRLLGGDFFGVNLSRKEKEPVVRGGLPAALPGTVPPGFSMEFGGYFELFKIAMQGHATETQLRNYYDAQCLTDDVMAYHLLQNRNGNELRIQIVGGFHSDYSYGLVKRLRTRAPLSKVGVVRFIDASDYTDTELRRLRQDPVHGDLADFIYFVNEPKAP
jgi:uncharacterized iron-regulated protein